MSAELKACREYGERVAAAALAHMPAAIFGALRDPDRADSIRRMVDYIEANPEAIPGERQERRDFLSFLIRAYNYMGRETEAEQEESAARAEANG
jgi:septal ring factor EnvC (AmiA/AmiB activator)